MSKRYSYRDAERAVERLARALGQPYGSYQITNDEPSPIGNERPEGRYKVRRNDGMWISTVPNGLHLDYAPIYGGCVIHRMADDGGTWISEPFSRVRRKPVAFINYVEELIARINERGESDGR